MYLRFLTTTQREQYLAGHCSATSQTCPLKQLEECSLRLPGAQPYTLIYVIYFTLPHVTLSVFSQINESTRGHCLLCDLRSLFVFSCLCFRSTFFICCPDDLHAVGVPTLTIGHFRLHPFAWYKTIYRGNRPLQPRATDSLLQNQGHQHTLENSQTRFYTYCHQNKSAASWRNNLSSVCWRWPRSCHLHCQHLFSAEKNVFVNLWISLGRTIAPWQHVRLLPAMSSSGERWHSTRPTLLMCLLMPRRG
jgi:hypothetical protein